VAVLDVVGSVPVLLRGDGGELKGEVWLRNTDKGDVTVTGASISVTFGSGPETAPIQIPPDSVVTAGGVRRLLITQGLEPFTAPGNYSASIDLSTSAGAVSIAATAVVEPVLALGFAPVRHVFTDVQSSDTLTGEVAVVNRGNVPFTVTTIPDEALFAVRATARLAAVAADGTVAVQPADGLAPLTDLELGFTNDTPTIDVGGWSSVQFTITTPAGLPANAHLRSLPRIGTERFFVDLLTA